MILELNKQVLLHEDQQCLFIFTLTFSYNPPLFFYQHRTKDEDYEEDDNDNKKVNDNDKDYMSGNLIYKNLL